VTHRVNEIAIEDLLLLERVRRRAFDVRPRKDKRGVDLISDILAI
jgi:hypothetical protein